ncbi:hypothetical protein [Streptomyces sp. NBC_00005]|uniref:hypothetical protein n=1 Tax=Streptomyces sp. NBC_00005 TaxID=2903609 RepID=UPI00324D9FC0
MADDRFILLAPGAARPGRIPLPPAFCVKAMTGDTDGRFSLLEVTLERDIPRPLQGEAMAKYTLTTGGGAASAGAALPAEELRELPHRGRTGEARAGLAATGAAAPPTHR